MPTVTTAICEAGAAVGAAAGSTVGVSVATMAVGSEVGAGVGVAGTDVAVGAGAPLHAASTSNSTPSTAIRSNADMSDFLVTIKISPTAPVYHGLSGCKSAPAIKKKKPPHD
jgi:hypothetical protein